MPSPLIGLATLARTAYQQQPLSGFHQYLLERLAVNDNDASALLDFSTILHLSGQAELARFTQGEALSLNRLYRLENTLGLPQDQTLSVLVFMAPGDLNRNTAIEFLTEGSPVTLHLLFTDVGQPLPANLPKHDIAFIAVCESEANQPLLKHLGELTHAWEKPLINPAPVIAAMPRDAISRRLQDLPGIKMPLSVRTSRSELNAIATGQMILAEDTWPLLVRPVDSHKGEGLAKLENAEELKAYLAQGSERHFFRTPFVEYRSRDKQYRKYRVVLMDGAPAICHLCISDHWMVHYMSAGMADETPAGEGKRTEESRCFELFDEPKGFASRHRDAFIALQHAIDLPYFGLDCAELPSGELLIFEVDCSMTVHNMDSPKRFPYKPPQMRKVFDAFYRMLLRHTEQT